MSVLPEDDIEPAEPLRIRVHPGLCEGWGECHRWAPDLYPLDENGHIAVHVMEVPPDRADDAWMAAKACPTGAITVVGPPADYWYDRLRRRNDARRRAERLTRSDLHDLARSEGFEPQLSHGQSDAQA
jgi:ferredoxin